MAFPSLTTGADWTPRRIVLATLTVAAVVLVFWLLYRYYIVPFTVFVGLVLGTAIRPAVEWLHRRGISRGLGVIIVYLALLALIAGFVFLSAPLIVQQVSTIAGKLPDYYENARSFLTNSRNHFLQRLGWQFAPALGAQPATAAPAEASSLDSVGQLLGLVGTLGTTVFVAVSVLVLGFYWTLDGERTVRSLILRISADRREPVRTLIGAMEMKVSSYIIGQTIVCGSVGAMSFVAYLIIGLPYAFVLGLFAAVLEIVPIVGPILGALPAALLALSLAPEKLVWVLVAVLVIQQSEAHLLIPRVMDKSVGVNPVVTILAIAAFGSLFGFPGALLAIPLAAIIQVLLNQYVFREDGGEQEQPEGRSQLSLLRYETQELVRDVRKQLRTKDDIVDPDNDRVEDNIERIASDLDSLLAQAESPEVSA